jgi:class 3 adenylate cyclase
VEVRPQRSRFVGSVREEESAFDRVVATVLFTDIVGSTEKAAALRDQRWCELLERSSLDHPSSAEAARGQEVDTAGDGFFATFDGPARAIRCACAICEAVHPLGLEVRAGLHTWEIEVVGDAVRGLAVHIGARVAAKSEPSEVLVSRTVRDLVAGSGISFEDAGEHQLNGVPDRWRLYRVQSRYA